MSLLSDYEQRTAWKYEPVRGLFHTNEELSRKVNPDGSYAPFPGSTAVFRPEKQCLQIIRFMQKLLYQKMGSSMLAQPLPASSIHMTLHDLISPEICVSSPEMCVSCAKEACAEEICMEEVCTEEACMEEACMEEICMEEACTEEDYRARTADSLKKAAGIIEGIRKDYAGQKITMAADRIVNMVSKSLVLMLKPQTEQDYELLLEMYGRFDNIVRLPYALTPHITLAYFRPGMLDGGQIGKALDFAQIHPENAPVFEFCPEGLTAQYFSDMQNYMDIPKRICFCCDGGLNRSVMAANIMNHLAQERNLPVVSEARSAYPDTQGWPVPEEVWGTLERHGVKPDKSYLTAKYLEDHEVPFFSEFAVITAGAMDRVSWLNLPEEKTYNVSRFFHGVRDPEYGEITREQAFNELYERAGNFLDAFEAKCRSGHMPPLFSTSNFISILFSG